MRTWWPGLAAIALAACCGAPRPSAVRDAGANRVSVRLEFEPVLRAPTVLHHAHECGESGEVPTGCTGVELTLPPGPVSFTMVVDGYRHELAVRVQTGMASVVWSLRR